jgi:tetratricopeptide (TPR) repeat protein
MSSQVIAAATADKKLAQAARKGGDYARAISLIERAIMTLEAEKPRLDSVEKGVVSSEDRALAEALADVYGSSGGIYRSAGEYSKSISAYDKGCAIEQDKRFGFVNSYNLTQRLVARVLFAPEQWVVSGQRIAGEDVPDCLARARNTVGEQTRGPRAGDVWAWADLGMLLLLLGEPADLAWDKLTELTRQPFVFASTQSVVSDLIERIAPAVSRGGADQRLVGILQALRTVRSRLEEAIRRLDDR